MDEVMSLTLGLTVARILAVLELVALVAVVIIFSND
jgi:hypothetical protein